MLPFQPAPGMAEVVLNWTQSDGEPAVNTFGVYGGSGVAWSHSDLVDLATAVGGWVHVGDGAGNTYLSRVSSECELVNVVARDLTVDGSTLATVTQNLAGEEDGTPLPNGVTISITARSGLTGRSNRGRTFLVGLTETSQDADDKNLADAAAITLWGLAFNSLIGAVSAFGGSRSATLCVISRWHATIRRDTATQVAIESFGFRDNALDFQRRRAPNHNRKR